MTRHRPATRYVEDSASLRAVAHPLRLQLLGHLRAHGPATASALGRALGESSGSTSYHLRQLARFGFIEPEPVQRSRRDKLWRAVHDSTSFRTGQATSAADRAAVDTIVSVQLENLLEGVGRRQREAGREPGAWDEAHFSTDVLLRVSPEGLARLKERVAELLDEVDSPADPEARLVQLHLQSFLHAEQPRQQGS